MTKNILKTTLVVLSAGSMLTGCDLEQPEAACFVQDATNWIAKYDRVDEPRLVVDGVVTDQACELVAPKAELLGVYKFVNPDAGNAATLALRPQGLASRGLADTTTDQSEQTAIGSFASEADANDFCGAPTFESARVVTATGGISYQFSNVRVYAAPNAPGTQLTGELTYTRDGCRSSYIISALWPAVGCIAGSTAADESCGEGSGLNPDFAATCLDGIVCVTGGTACCVPAKAIPSFN